MTTNLRDRLSTVPTSLIAEFVADAPAGVRKTNIYWLAQDVLRVRRVEAKLQQETT